MDWDRWLKSYEEWEASKSDSSPLTKDSKKLLQSIIGELGDTFNRLLTGDFMSFTTFFREFWRQNRIGIKDERCMWYIWIPVQKSQMLS